MFFDLFGLFLGDTFFDDAGSILGSGFGLFETQTGDGTDDFDDVDLFRAGVGEDDVELSLLFFGSTGIAGTGSCDNCRLSRYAKLLLKLFYQLAQFEHRQTGDEFKNIFFCNGHVVSF